jgi:hypothetical protein
MSIKCILFGTSRDPHPGFVRLPVCGGRRVGRRLEPFTAHALRRPAASCGHQSAERLLRLHPLHDDSIGKIFSLFWMTPKSLKKKISTAGNPVIQIRIGRPNDGGSGKLKIFSFDTQIKKELVSQVVLRRGLKETRSNQ